MSKKNKIPTPAFEVGQRFWVARCRKRYATETKTVNGEVWRRENETYYPYAKEKEIISLTIRVSSEAASLVYMVQDVNNDNDTPPLYYSEDKIVLLTEKQAIEKARYHADRCEEYFGG